MRLGPDRESHVRQGLMRSEANGVARLGGKGLPGALGREILIESSKRRFGAEEAVPAAPALEFLSDNGEIYIATVRGH
ncbi:hypothetical protein D3C71_1433230 [compost metagenome]